VERFAKFRHNASEMCPEIQLRILRQWYKILPAPCRKFGAYRVPITEKR
jgi:hypothetical protein